MTLLPVETVRVTVPAQDSWPDDGNSPYCCCPSCAQAGTQTHHVVRRSETAGPKRWVAVDGLVLLNELRVCLWCHDKLNNHDAWIRYVDGEGWVWYAAARRGELRLDPERFIQHPKSGRWFKSLGRVKGVQWNPAMGLFPSSAW